MFREVNSRVSFPELEERILKLWRDNDTFARSVTSRKGNQRFVFYEGPPTANGSPGIHHVLARVFKDVVLRYRTMQGCYIPRIAGWDTHGLPVELEVEAKLGFTNKAQIEEYGIARFNALCRESVQGYLKEWEAMTERIAYWVDLEHPYVTMDNNYIETGWWIVKQLWEKGLVYQGYRVAPHCPRCGTSLSSHEVALGYREDAEDPSVFVKFRLAKSLYHSPGFLAELRAHYGDREADFAERLLDLTGESPVYLLAWTTTPWTLPGNTALAVASDEEYVLVKLDDEYLILAAARMEAAGLAETPVVARFRGADLVDLRYEPLYNPSDYDIPVETMAVLDKEGHPLLDALWKKDGAANYPVITTDFVTMEDGTGIVHVAPAYGEADYDAGLSNRLEFVHLVDLAGVIKGSYPFSGHFVKDADPHILKDLDERGLLLRSGKLRHTYPFCWRCEAPLLYYAKQSWYIRTTKVKEQLLEGNQEINWYPEYIKYGRFGDWLNNNVDWAFSRERYWGTPLPVWRCGDCDHAECIGGVAELKDKPGVKGFTENLDLHRPYVDDISFDCSQCGKAGAMKRVPEVIDCWFDSGAMPLAQHHYPFENDKLLEDGRFPADYICEAVDQTRGWFYSLHAIATLLFGRPSYRNVICLGHILDEKGEKMSKSRGNVVEPMGVISQYGADAVRWYCLTASPPGNVRRFSERLVAEIARRFMHTLWNVYSFFVMYANIDEFVPGKDQVPPEPTELDRWIISELNQLILDVDEALKGYNPTEAGRKIEGFVNDLSNWYVRRSRRRFWKSEGDSDKLAAYNTLYECLVTLAKLLGPFIPFVAEDIYQNLVVAVSSEAPDSVHLADFPTADETKIDKQLSRDTRLAMKISSLGRAARAKAGIKVRQPLACALVRLSGAAEEENLKRVKPQVMEELNIKDLAFIDDDAMLDETKYVITTEGSYQVVIPNKDSISPELLAEGLTREIVHRLQTMRRAAGFEISDHIATCYQGDDYVMQVMATDSHAQYIKRETLSRELISGAPSEGMISESYRLGGHEIVLGIKRLA